MDQDAPRISEDKLREAHGVAEDLLRSTFPKATLVSVELSPDYGQYGDEILWVNAFFRGSDTEIDPEGSLAIRPEMGRRLRAIGITALPIHRFRDIDDRPYGPCS